MHFSDKTLTCRECNKTFLFTAGEQDFFRQKGLVNEPGRCPDCRMKRRQQAAANGVVQATETPVSSVREVSTVVCAECGKETTVPFRPRLARPVYCSECFQRQRTAAAATVAEQTPVS
jgi:CxxC-x17-CxxC domain-containing protein